MEERGKAEFRAIRERCGISQQAVADHFGVQVMTVKRWERTGDTMPPEKAWEWLDHMLLMHMSAVETALDAVDSTARRQGGPPHHVDLLYYRGQAHYDRYGRDRGDYAVANARSREIAARLGERGIEVRFRYPEEDEAGFQRLANTRG